MFYYLLIQKFDDSQECAKCLATRNQIIRAGQAAKNQMLFTDNFNAGKLMKH